MNIENMPRKLATRLTLITIGITQNSFATSGFYQTLSEAAIKRTAFSITYDGSYRKIAYPNGGVPADIGVCTDVVIRSYRSLGIDLQKQVHEDMRDNFGAYPARRLRGQKTPDANIDHRCVPNLQTYLARHGKRLASGTKPERYQPGDIVTWTLPGNLPHIGIATERRNAKEIPLVVHNIGRGPVLEDVMFNYPISGHFRFAGSQNGVDE